MAKVRFKEINYGSFGKCIQLSNGKIELVVTVDLGPRIIRFGFIGEANEFYETAQGTAPNSKEAWQFMGGHRLWHSPEHEKRTYSPDNSPVEWSMEKEAIKVCQKTEPWVQIKKEMSIALDPESNRVRITHFLTNENAWSVELSAWALSVMAPGGRSVIPQPNRETGLLGNRVIALWPYSKMNDPRVSWGEKFIILTQDPEIRNPFKLGINNERGWAAYFNHGNLFIKRFSHFMHAEYPDFGVSYESYTNDFMLEMETLSPLIRLEPGQTISHVERWELVKDVELNSHGEEELEKVLAEYLE